jgi:hypothetical protein
VDLKFSGVAEDSSRLQCDAVLSGKEANYVFVRRHGVTAPETQTPLISLSVDLKFSGVAEDSSRLKC